MSRGLLAEALTLCSRGCNVRAMDEASKYEAHWRSKISAELYQFGEELSRWGPNPAATRAVYAILQEAGNRVGKMPDNRKLCSICKRELDVPGDRWSVDCGGDCYQCMQEEESNL